MFAVLYVHPPDGCSLACEQQHALNISPQVLCHQGMRLRAIGSPFGCLLPQCFQASCYIGHISNTVPRLPDTSREFAGDLTQTVDKVEPMYRFFVHTKSLLIMIQFIERYM